MPLNIVTDLWPILASHSTDGDIYKYLTVNLELLMGDGSDEYRVAGAGR